MLEECAVQQEGFLKAWCGDSRMVTVPGGHWVLLENVQATNTAIEEFLQRK